MVFTTKEPGKGWDGRIGSTDQPAGTYVWMLRARDYTGCLIEDKGTVILVR